jgi:arylsulfatase A-like enzyme
MPRTPRRLLTLALLGLCLARPSASPAARRPGEEPQRQRFPNVVVLTVDTLRADRLSSYGYSRPTTPNVDRLLAGGVRFTQARTVEPLTNPALCSMLTSLHPHEHGATRNGLRMRSGLASFARSLTRRGYRTAAFVGNWTIKNRISGLGDHFQRYDEVFTRKRWLGLFKGEANAEDLTTEALDWLAEHRASTQRRPFLLWIHYVEPHAPYRLQEPFARRLGIALDGEVPRPDRYDTEVAFTDHQIGRLLAVFERDPQLKAETLFVFTADHGESLGEHSDWGHGRTVYDPAIRIPLGFAWAGRVPPGGVVDAPASNIDVAPTILGLAGLPIPETFRGFDWTGVLGGGEPPRDRVTWFQAHKGAVLSKQEAPNARRRGLLEVGSLRGGRKEVLRLHERRRILFDLAADPFERRSLVPQTTEASAHLRDWIAAVHKGLATSDRLSPIEEIDPENVEQLRALGYGN